MTFSSVVIACLAFTVPSVSACDLTVKVFSFESRPMRASVELRKHNGETLQPTYHNNDALFCDVGIMPFKIVVGKGFCGETTIDKLTVVPGSPRIVPVFYRMCHGFYIASHCYVLVRVLSEDGEPLPNAEVRVESKLHSLDQYGRALVFVPVNESYRYSVAAAGHEGATGRISCGDAYERQEVVVAVKKR